MSARVAERMLEAPERVRPAPPALEVTVVIPAYDEAESLRELVPAVAAVLRQERRSYEILVVDDGSTTPSRS